MATPDLTSAALIDKLYSSVGVDLRTDDGTEADLIADIVDYASETIASYTLQHYDSEDLSSSKWVQRRATIIAAYYLSLRRANAPQFVAEYKRILEELEEVNKGKIIIPDVPVRAASVPALSSYRIDDRYWINKQRVVVGQSTKPYPGQQGYQFPSAGDII